MYWNFSPSRYSVCPAATRRRVNIRLSRRSTSGAFIPQGRHRSRKWQAEHWVWSALTEVLRATVGTGAILIVRVGAWSVAVDMMSSSFTDESMGKLLRGAAHCLGQLVELGGLVQETHSAGR